MATVTVIGEVVIDRVFSGNTATDIAGGSAANMVLAMQRAGHTSDLRARFSKDADGEFLYSTALKNGIGLRGSVRADEPATIVDVVLDDDGLPTYGFHMNGTADWAWTNEELYTELPAGTDAIVVGSIASVWQPGADRIFAWAKDMRAAGHVLAYDPNARPTTITSPAEADRVRGTIARWVRSADIVKVSDEDIEFIAPGINAESLVAEWSKQGPDLVVLTRGAYGAVAYRHGDVVVDHPGVSVNVIDTVGAGDTFMGWLLTTILDSSEPFSTGTITEAVNIAIAAAAWNCEQQGCNPPRRENLG